MDIDEFLDKEIQAEKKEDTEEKPVAIEVTKEEKDTIKHYFELWSKISEEKFKWDKELYTELDKSAKKVRERLDKLLPTIGREKDIIKQLIGKALKELEIGKYESATRLYSEISDMRNSLPDFLLEEKKELNKEIFQLYEKLHDQIDSKFINDFKDSIARVHNLVRNSFDSFGNGDIEKAKNLYEKALDIYNNLPNGFLSQKIEISNQLIRLYKDLSLQIQIKSLQKQLSKKPYLNYKGDDELGELEEVIKERNLERAKISEKYAKVSSLFATSPEEMHILKNRTLLQGLIARKLNRAKVNLKRGLYLEAKKNIDAVLKINPE
ncbi:MAG: hypothetical protein IIB81_04435, partial [Nanoarchaeota archaeon]|nr:hypothetical protein [Nanoarchaeota archaeon]